MSLYFCQTRHNDRWCPELWPSVPEMTGDRIKRTDGGGARCRSLWDPRTHEWVYFVKFSQNDAEVGLNNLNDRVEFWQETKARAKETKEATEPQ